ncbi:MAG TPA: GAF domain-containing protein [Pirellulales bacterium]|nr:GAF domain-containing protein [Pirellulales bacterium]
MAKSIPAYLKLHDEDGAAPPAAQAGDSGAIAEFCRAFESATGWPLRLPNGAGGDCEADSVLPKLSDSMCSAPVEPGVGISPGHIRVGFNSAARKLTEQSHVAIADAAAAPRAAHRCTAESARGLRDAAERLFNQLARARQIIRRRDAELAARLPVGPRAQEPEQFDRLLKSVLRAGADACECQAAALYTLDDATTSLELRASVGLPSDRLEQPPRPLKGAIADLEALLGHAVALERATAFGPWRVPEDFAAALCVPVSSATTELGTLWLFSDRRRDFTDRQTNLAEIIAGRLAAELERSALLGQLREQQRT